MVSIIITGGKGGLASVLRTRFAEMDDVLAPGRDELNVVDERCVEDFFNGVDSPALLVCNAGATLDQILLKMGEQMWDEALSVNLKSAFLCARAVAKKMCKARVGHILFIGSYSGFSPPSGQVNYASAKAGLIGLTKSLAAELGGRGVRVNMVVPGWMETKMTAAVAGDRVQSVKQAHCLKAFNTPEAVAAFVKTLHYDMPFTSGQVFHLDSRILT